MQISDIHVGRWVSDSYLVECMQMVRDLAPDVLVITGDTLSVHGQDDGVVFEQLRALLMHLPHGKLGTFAILGNHEYGRGWSDAGAALRAMQELERAGARVLRNASANIGGLDLVGVDDL